MSTQGHKPKRPVISWLRTRLKRSRLYARWLRNEAPKHPRYELYARRQGTLDRRAFIADRAGGAEAVRRSLAPFHKADIPKIIWIYWQQGEAEAPFVVRRCIARWRQMNPGWEVRVLDAQNVSEHLDMSDYHDGLPPRFFANLLRMRLMRTHGGVWTDATVYCHRPLDDWLAPLLVTGFFVFRSPGAGRWFASWFLVSERDHLLPTLWEQGYAPFVKSLTYVPDLYFSLSYMFQWQIKRHRQALALWRQSPAMPSTPTFFMMEALRGTLPVARLHEMLESGTPVSKLTWKEIVDEAAFEALCAEIDAEPAASGSA